MASNKVDGESSYFLFIYEQLHTLYLAISKLLKACIVTYLPSDSFTTCGARKKTESLAEILPLICRSCYILLRAIESNTRLLRIRMEVVK